MPETAEQLAIIRRPRLGVTDRGIVALMFETYVTDSSAASQFISLEHEEQLEQALQLLRTVGDVRELEGRPCWVDVSRGGLIVYVSPARMGGGHA